MFVVLQVLSSLVIGTSHCLCLSLAATEAEQQVEKRVLSNVSENKSKLDSGIEELLRDFQWNAPQIDTTNLFDKVYK